MRNMFRVYPRGKNTKSDINAAIDIIYDGQDMWLVGQKEKLTDEKKKEIIGNIRAGIWKFTINKYYKEV